MYKRIFLFSLFLLAFNSKASQSGQSTGEGLSDLSSCYRGVFSDYNSWLGFMNKRFSARGVNEDLARKKLSNFKSRFTESDFNHYKNKLTCQTFTYTVDKMKVNGFVIKPKEIKNQLPSIIYNRGGNGNFGAVVFGNMMANLFPLADQGFVVIGSQYRGTFSGDDSLDEFGGKDVNDVVSLIDLIPQIDGADQNKVGMLGVSRGAMQTHLAMKEVSNIKAIATIAGVVDLKKELEFRPEMEKVYQKRIPNYQAEKENELAKRSVINWVDNLSKNVPILLMHGDKDKRVSVDNSKTFAAGLKSEKVPYKLVIYKEDNHFLENNKKAVVSELSSWFHTHLSYKLKYFLI